MKNLTALSLSLCLTACSSLPTGSISSNRSGPGTQQVLQTHQALPTQAQSGLDSLAVKVSLPASAKEPVHPFQAKSAQTNQAAYVRLSIKAVDLSREYINSGGITLNGVSHLVAFNGATSVSLTVEDIPPGKNRVVIAQVYDADGKELSSLRSMGLFHSKDRGPATESLRFSDENPGTNVIEQSVTRRNVPLLSTLEQAIDAKDTGFIDQIENHLDAMATEFDKLLYGANPVGTTFVNEPQRIDPIEVYAAMKAQLQSTALVLPVGLPSFFTTHPTLVDGTSSVTVYLATPTGFSFTQNMTVVIDDPGSTPVNLASTGMSSPQAVTLNNVERGIRRLTVYGPGDQVLGHTTVTVDPDTGNNFAGNAGSSPASPLFLIGGETGIVISSLSQTSTPQGVPITLNGVGYAASPAQADNTVKFGSTVVPSESATSSTIHVVVPDLIGGLYPVTVTRLGVTTNFQNFNLLPAITALSVSNGIVGSSVTLTGTGFNPTASLNTVKFGTTLATVTAAAPDGHSLTVKVPTGIWGTHNLSVTVGSQTSTETHPYTVIPHITSMAANGTIGSSQTIVGTGFSPTAGENTVRFASTPGTATATVTGAQTDQLIVTVPPGIWSAKDVSIQVGSQISNTQPFGITPVILDTNPNAGIPGIFITLNGTGFSPVENENTVIFGSIFFGTVQANVTNATTTSIKLVVFPVVVGNLPVTVQVGDQISNGSVFASVLPPAITELSQSSGKIGDSIQINGSNFSTTPGNNIVKFGSTNATVTAATANQLTVTVPVTSGAQPVTVTVDGNPSNASNFAITPTLTSFSPTTARAGDNLTITGTGFSTTPMVQFDALPATIVGTPTNTRQQPGFRQQNNQRQRQWPKRQPERLPAAAEQPLYRDLHAPGRGLARLLRLSRQPGSGHQRRRFCQSELCRKSLRPAQ
jgi:cell division inhibitor SulA